MSEEFIGFCIKVGATLIIVAIWAAITWGLYILARLVLRPSSSSQLVTRSHPDSNPGKQDKQNDIKHP